MRDSLNSMSDFRFTRLEQQYPRRDETPFFYNRGFCDSQPNALTVASWRYEGASLAVSSIGEEVSEKVSADQDRRSQEDIAFGNSVAQLGIQQVFDAQPASAVRAGSGR